MDTPQWTLLDCFLNERRAMIDGAHYLVCKYGYDVPQLGVWTDLGLSDRYRIVNRVASWPEAQRALLVQQCEHAGVCL
jgi:hypothetical protein